MVLDGGVSLVKEIYQKFEESVEECILACDDYAAGASESIKKLWDEVISDLDHQNNVKESNSSIKLEYNSVTDVSSKNEISSANKMANSKGLLVHIENLGEIADTLDSISDSTSSPRQNDSILEDNEASSSSRKCKYQSANLSYNLHYEDTHTTQLDTSKVASGSTSSPRQDCNEVVVADIAEKLTENAKNDTIASIHEDMHVKTLPSKSQDLCDILSCNGHIGDKLSEDCKEIPDTFNSTSSTCSMRQYCDQARDPGYDESCVLSMKVIDYSDINKDFQLSNQDKAFQITLRDDYEEVEAQNWVELEKEISLIQMRKANNKSNSMKKKLQNVIKLLKRSNKVNHYQNECNDIGFKNETTEEPSSIPGGHMSLTLSSQNSIDSGWELI